MALISSDDFISPDGRPSGLKVFFLTCLLLLLAAVGFGLELAERRWRQAAPAPTEDLTPPPPELRPDTTLTSDPSLLAPIDASEAERRNAQIAPSTEPIQPALSFDRRGASLDDAGRALDCLTTAVYYEAASESEAGQRAVAQVVLNRVRHVAFPNTVCGVVFQGSERSTGCQFSFTCDGSMARAPSIQGLARARVAAAMVFNGYVERSVGLATHYHTTRVFPYWSPRLVKIGTIGAHIFLRWPGDWGQPRAFRGRYRGDEPAIGEVARTAPEPDVEGDSAAASADGGGPLPTRWDRPLLRPDDPAAAPPPPPPPSQGGTAIAAPIVPAAPPARPAPAIVGERRIIGIEPQPAAPPADRPPRP